MPCVTFSRMSRKAVSIFLSGACSMTIRSPSASGMPACSSDAIWRVTAATCSPRILLTVSTPVMPLIRIGPAPRRRRSRRSVTYSFSFLSLSRASRGVSASMSPRFCLFAPSIALYSKTGIAIPLHHVELRHAQDLVGGRLSGEQLLDAGHAQRPQPALERAALDLARGRLVDDLLLDHVVDLHDLIDRRAARVSGTE